MTIAKTKAAAAKKTNRNLSALFKNGEFNKVRILSFKDTKKKAAYPFFSVSSERFTGFRQNICICS